MCTSVRFSDAEGNMYFGRNLDWNCDYGEEVIITPKNYKRTYAFEGEGSAVGDIIGVAIVVNDMPLYFDAANDQGLAIAGLNFPGFAQYEEKPVEGKTNLAAYEFPLWVTSNFTTVDEVEEALKNVAIVAKQVNDVYPVALLHYIIADKTRSIVVEYMADGMHVYHDEVDCLTNQPTFAWQQENLRNYISLTSEFPATVSWDKIDLAPYGSGSGMRGMPGDFYSPSRFVRAAFFNSHYPEQKGEKDNVTRLFKTLQGSAMIKGGAQMSDGTYEYTMYTGGYSQATKTYYFSTYDNPAIQATCIDQAPAGSTELFIVK